MHSYSQLRVLDPACDERLYKATHANHPCAIWVRARVGNYVWLHEHFVGLLDEYTFRYGKHHKSGDIENLLVFPPYGLEHGFTEPAQVIPVECQHEDPVVAYRTCYATHKIRLYGYTRRAEPTWLRDYIV